MTSLVHLIYASAATVDFNEESLAALLLKARETNAELGVTGMLLYTNGDFFQILEGESETVDILYKRITADKRHQRVTKIIRESIVERSFAEWTMGFSRLTTQELTDLDGQNDFFGRASCFRDLDDSRAKKLLAAFADGRWRARISGGAARVQSAGRRYAIADA